MYEYITHKGYEYKMLILYLLKNMSNDIKEIILDLIEQNLEHEFNYLDILLNDELEIGSSYYEWFYDPDWYRPDIDGTLSYSRLSKNTYYPPWAQDKWPGKYY